MVRRRNTGENSLSASCGDTGSGGAAGPRAGPGRARRGRGAGGSYLADGGHVQQLPEHVDARGLQHLVDQAGERGAAGRLGQQQELLLALPRHLALGRHGGPGPARPGPPSPAARSPPAAPARPLPAGPAHPPHTAGARRPLPRVTRIRRPLAEPAACPAPAAFPLAEPGAARRRSPAARAPPAGGAEHCRPRRRLVPPPHPPPSPGHSWSSRAVPTQPGQLQAIPSYSRPSRAIPAHPGPFPASPGHSPAMAAFISPGQHRLRSAWAHSGHRLVPSLGPAGPRHQLALSFFLHCSHTLPCSPAASARCSLIFHDPSSNETPPVRCVPTRQSMPDEHPRIYGSCQSGEYLLFIPTPGNVQGQD